MKRLKILFFVLLLSALRLPFAAAGGFYNSDHGSKAVAMAGAFAAQADDPSAVFYNPAGIMQLDGSQAMVGLTVITMSSSFESDGNAVMGTVAGQTTHPRDHTWLGPPLLCNP